MKQVFRAHRLCKQDGPLGRISIPTKPRCVARAMPGKRERCRSVWSPISAVGWPNVESRRRRLPPSCLGRTFALEHGVDVRHVWPATLQMFCKESGCVRTTRAEHDQSPRFGKAFR
jgi:hypothetical protein